MNENAWETLLGETVQFTQRLIQTPSMPTEEGEIAQVVVREMEKLGYDEVWLDTVGNVNGRVYGHYRDLPALVFNSHLDHVDPGDLELWPYPPYSGEIHDGRIFGRGACDIKGPMAVQVYSLAALLREGLRPRRDTVVSAVVQEETGGAGAQYWIRHLDYPVEMLILGEPSSNQISLGHRGIWHTWVRFNGRSVHASVPESGVNPNYAAAEFLCRLNSRKDELRLHPILGVTSVAPTIIEVDTKSPNVTPAWTRILLDFRTGTESVSSLKAFIQSAAEGLDATIEGPGPGWGEVEEDAPIRGYYTSPESTRLKRAHQAITEGMGWKPDLISYKFATDGRHIQAETAEICILGYSPAEEQLAHTVIESISIEMMSDSLRGYAQLALSY